MIYERDFLLMKSTSCFEIYYKLLIDWQYLYASCRFLDKKSFFVISSNFITKDRCYTSIKFQPVTLRGNEGWKWKLLNQSLVKFWAAGRIQFEYLLWIKKYKSNQYAKWFHFYFQFYFVTEMRVCSHIEYVLLMFERYRACKHVNYENWL